MKLLQFYTAIAFFCFSIFPNELLALPTATISGTTTVCQPAAPIRFDITFTATSGTAPFVFTYNIDGSSNINTASSQSNIVVVPYTEGNPSVTTFNLVSVTDATGTQSQTGSATITINALPTVAATPINICLNAYSITTDVNLTSYENTVNNTGGNIFEWFSDAGVLISNPNNYQVSSPNPNPSSNYTISVGVQVTNTVSGCTNYENVNISVGYYPIVTLPLTTVCVGQTTVLPDNINIFWSFPLDPNIAALDFGFPFIIRGISAGITYLGYQVVNGGFCTYNGSQEIRVNPLPTATISGTATVNRNAPEPEVTFSGVVGTGAFTFTYNIDGGAEQTCSGSVSQPTTTAGIFVYNLVKVEDINGCSQPQTGSATITVKTTLAAELINFEAHPLSKNIELNWLTASEKSNERFDIQRSTDGRLFSTIGTIKGNGTTAEPHNYQFLDESPYAGANYYRLKQVDVDGQFTYSKTVSVVMSNAAKNVSVYPNPVKDKVIIETTIQGDYTIKLFDMTGKLLQTLTAQQATIQLTINDLPNGVYMISVKSSVVQETFKIVKQ